ncbi:MAG: DNA-binding protein [Actinobacteria bacterium]|nr:DNA-binding protein [Acidobacteriota bacterium]MCA1707336.1 DNA-binding protein [Actinomycetota bacterium]
MTGKIVSREIAKTITLDEIRRWPATVSLGTACGPFGISQSYGYALARAGQFPCRVLRVGRRYVVPTEGIIAVLTADDSAAAAS